MTGAKRINFEDIVKLETLSDDEHIVLVYLSSRVMRLSLKDSLPFLLAVQRNMKVCLLHVEAFRGCTFGSISFQNSSNKGVW